jgi:hypothetical protein
MQLRADELGLRHAHAARDHGLALLEVQMMNRTHRGPLRLLEMPHLGEAPELSKVVGRHMGSTASGSHQEAPAHGYKYA